MLYVRHRAALIRNTLLTISKRYREFCKKKAGTKIESMSKRFKGVDLVFDLSLEKGRMMWVYAFWLEKTYRYPTIFRSC